MAGVNKRGFQDGSPTGVSPPYKRSGSDSFVDNFVKAITDERVVSALQAIFAQTITNDLKRRDDKIESLEKMNDDLNEKISNLTQNNNKLIERITKLESQADDQEQYSRRNSIRFSIQKGEIKGESCEDIVMETLSEMGIKEVTKSDIDRCHRVGKRSRDKERQILCKFKSYKPRSVVFSAKKSAPAGVFISEDLTAKKSNLLYKARILRREGKIKQCWSYDGRIYIKMKDDTSRVVYNEAYLLDKVDKTYSDVAGSGVEPDSELA